MIQAFINRILLKRHFWRYATFSEVAEIYTSRTLRIFALRLVTVFTVLYLYKLGYSPVLISLIFAGFYAYKIFCSWPSAWIISKIGTKRATLVSNVLAAISMAFLPMVPEHGMLAIVLWVIFQAGSSCLYDMCYLVGFSKVKSVSSAGKEIGYMNILERVANSLGPIIGGVIASLYGPEVVMIISSVLFILAAVPLFATGEPVTLKPVSFRGFPWRLTWRSLVAETAVGYDVYVTGTAWTLFMAVVIFAGSGDDIYAKIGAFASIAFISALVMSYAFGKMIDRNGGLSLLRFSSVANAVTHALRGFIGTPAGIISINLLNEAATTGYSMSFLRGMFDMADRTGNRITYILLIEMVVNVGPTLAALLSALLLALFPAALALQVFFVISAFVVLFIMVPRFPLYIKRG